MSTTNQNSWVSVLARCYRLVMDHWYLCLSRGVDCVIDHKYFLPFSRRGLNSYFPLMWSALAMWLVLANEMWAESPLCNISERNFKVWFKYIVSVHNNEYTRISFFFFCHEFTNILDRRIFVSLSPRLNMMCSRNMTDLWWDCILSKNNLLL